MRISTKKIAYIGLLAAISVILNALTFTLSGSSFAFGFTYVPTFLAGYFFGPAAGFFVGLIGDVLGCIIWPKGAWIPLITLASALMGVIPGLVRTIKINEKWLLVISYILMYLVCSMWLNTFALWSVYAATKKTFWVYLAGRIPFQITNMLMNLLISLVTLPFFQRLLASRAKSAERSRDASSAGKESNEESLEGNGATYGDERQVGN